VRVLLTDRVALQPMRMGIEIASALAKLDYGTRDMIRGYPGHFDASKMIELLGNSETIRRLGAGDTPASINASWDRDIAAFHKTRDKYLLYQ